MDSARLISTCKKIALISFLGGTFISILFYFSDDTVFAFLGLGYIIIALIVNLVMLARLYYQVNNDQNNKRNIFKTVGIMALNIPVAILYCWFAIILLNTVRITFINSTQAQIDNVIIEGCQEKLIPKLSPGQSQTVWINIPSDCGVSITYKMNGRLKEENVTGYVTNDGGYIMTFKIGTSQKPHDMEF